MDSVQRTLRISQRAQNYEYYTDTFELGCIRFVRLLRAL